MKNPSSKFQGISDFVLRISILSATAEKGAIGFDREARIKEACRGLLTRKQAELNTTADSFEYALAA